MVLTVYSAADLLVAPGCPVCRYVAEASDRYLRWFALEGHARADVISTFCASLGPCARHARLLMRQPGAAIRLTMVYRYAVAAAGDALTGRAGPAVPCPGCAHEAAATARAVETLADGLNDGTASHRYRELGGVCLTHFAPVSARTRASATDWVCGTLQEAIDRSLGQPEWLAGSDPDTGVRRVLRQELPAAGADGSGACHICLAGARAERDVLARSADGTRYPDAAALPSPACGAHLADLAAGAADMLVPLRVQATALRAGLPSDSGSRSRIIALVRRGRRLRSGSCPVCAARQLARQVAAGEILTGLRAPDASHLPLLCARDLLTVRRQAGSAADGLMGSAAAVAASLVRDLTLEFEATTWTRRSTGTQATEPAAFRRAAVFLDGEVYGGCPPRPWAPGC